MTRLEKCKLAIELGYTYDKETGIIFGLKGKEIIGKNNRNYIVINLPNKKQLKGHQFAWYYIYNECVECIDHIDGNTINNKINNLRSVTHQKNMWNIKCKGFTITKKGKYLSQIRFNKKQLYIGTYNNEQDARDAYLSMKKLLHII